MRTEPMGVPVFKATRYVYARNARTVSYVLGETWNVDAAGVAIDYTVTFAREFRYDGARQRYLDRQYDTGTNGLNHFDVSGNFDPQFVVMNETWTDYDGDNTYGDFKVTAGVVTDGTGYELGLAQINRPTPTTFDTLYAHNDHLGTLRGQSNSTGFTSFQVHTAFGEDMTDLGQRLAYAGAFGYQTNPNFNSLHVGERYYDPSSGRFLQRDPIGIFGSINVYGYVNNTPTSFVDPLGLQVAAALPAAAAAAAAVADGPLPVGDAIGVGILVCAAAVAAYDYFFSEQTTTDFNYAVGQLGLNANEASKALHDAKEQVGYRGDVEFGLESGDIAIPGGEVIGNLAG